VHLLNHVQEKCDRIADRSLILPLISAESETPLLNQVIDVSAARSSALKQTAPQKAQLILQFIARMLCPFNHPQVIPCF
jgi:hypothetical protein